MTTGNDWREAVGRTWADNYRLTDRSFAGLTERLLARIGGCEGKAVLDIGCGAGELSLAIAHSLPMLPPAIVGAVGTASHGLGSASAGLSSRIVDAR